MEDVLRETYEDCLAQSSLPDDEIRNCVKKVYEPFTQQEISVKIAQMLTPDNIHAEVSLVYQTVGGLHEAIPGCPGDWYFSGDYPTPGGTRLVNRAFVNYYEGNTDKR